MRKLTLGAIALAASTVIGSGASHATFTGRVWTATGDATRIAAVTAASANATIANVSALGADNGAFTTNTINYFAPPGSTVQDFLTSGQCTGTACANTTTLQNSAFLFTSTGSDARLTGSTLPAVPSQGLGVFMCNAGNVCVRHDDGEQVAIDGVVIAALSSPLPTSQITNQAPFAGTHQVTLSYGENSGLPAVLQANLTNVPEPVSLALLGSALVAFGVMRRRRKTD